MDKNTNDYLILGISILVIGLLLGSYSFAIYTEIQNLDKKIDFEEIDDNRDMSTSEKYYEYLSISDYLNQKLTKNKNILIKNSSCVYLDYAQHNAIEMYRLTKKSDFDETKISVAAGNLRGLYNMLDNYTTCKRTAEYKSELQDLLDDIQASESRKLDKEQRMNDFLNGYKDKYTKDSQEDNAAIAPNSDLQQNQIIENDYYQPQQPQTDNNPEQIQ